MFTYKVEEVDDETLERYLDELEECKQNSRSRRRKTAAMVCQPARIHVTLDPDSDLDTDLEDAGANPRSSRRLRKPPQVYEAACKKYNIMPCSAFVEQLENGDTSITLRHKTLGPDDTKAIVIALIKDFTVQELNLADNNIGPEGAQDLEILLEENQNIRKLDISENTCGLAGTIALGEIIRHNDMLREIRASGCGFLERDAFYIVDALQHNLTLRELDLSYNHLMEEGGILLGHAIAKTESLQTLNLSWNHLRMRGAQAVAFGLERNDSLTHLDLSWNGFADEGTEALSEALKSNTSLTYLDISSNRISPKGATYLAEILEKNTTLQTLKVSYNPMTSEGVTSMARALKGNMRNALKLLEIRGATVTHDIWIYMHDIQQINPDFQLVYGSIVQSPDPIGERIIDGAHERNDPLKILMMYIENEGLRVWDMFTQLDKDGDMKLSPDEVKAGLQMLGVPIAADKLQELVSRLDENNDGEIEFSELMSGTAKVRIKDHTEKVKQKRQQTLQSQLKQKVKEQLVTMQINELKPVVNAHSARSRSPGGDLARARSPNWKTVQRTTMALHLAPDGRAGSARSRAASPIDPDARISGYAVDGGLDPDTNSSGITVTID